MTGEWRLLLRRPTDGVEVWAVPLDWHLNAVERAFHALPAHERAAAERLRGTRDRARFIAAHAALRRLLGARLRIPMERVVFDRAEHGKPALPQGMDRRLCFNLSHSHDVALVAFADMRRVGVDVEQIASVDVDEMIKRHCTSAEQISMLRLATPARTHSFVRAWTAKEAYVKALGIGIGAGLADLGFDWTASIRELTSPDGYRLTALDSLRGFCGTVAVGPMSPTPAEGLDDDARGLVERG